MRRRPRGVSARQIQKRDERGGGQDRFRSVMQGSGTPENFAESRFWFSVPSPDDGSFPNETAARGMPFAAKPSPDGFSRGFSAFARRNIETCADALTRSRAAPIIRSNREQLFIRRAFAHASDDSKNRRHR